jgi:hypothetical protein
MARELPAPLPRAKVAFFKGQVTGEVEAAGVPQIEDGKPGEGGEAASLKVPLGGGAELTCFIYPESTDVAGTISKVLDAAAKGVQFERVWLADVVMTGDDPTVYVNAEYTAAGPNGKLFGQFKLMLHAGHENPVYCQHDEVGYQASFRRITQGLVKSLKAASPAAPARFVQVHVVKLGDRPVGFEQSTVTEGENGALIGRQTTAMFLPRSARELSLSDDILTHVTDRSGNLVALGYAEAENGELASNVELERSKERQYAFTGKHAGKDVKGSFRSKGKQGPLTWTGVAGELRRSLLAGKAKELTLEEYHPGVDPTKPVQVIYRRGEGRAVTMVLGALEMKGVLDENGLLDHGELPMGSHKLTFTRAFVRGTP